MLVEVRRIVFAVPVQLLRSAFDKNIQFILNLNEDTHFFHRGLVIDASYFYDLSISGLVWQSKLF